MKSMCILKQEDEANQSINDIKVEVNFFKSSYIFYINHDFERMKKIMSDQKQFAKDTCLFSCKNLIA